MPKKTHTLLSKVILPGKKRVYILLVHEIIYCQAAENYTIIFTKDEKSRIVSLPILKVEEKINSNGFFRIHRSFLVNMSFLHEYNDAMDQVILQNGAVLPVARRIKDELTEWLTNFTVIGNTSS